MGLSVVSRWRVLVLVLVVGVLAAGVVQAVQLLGGGWGAAPSAVAGLPVRVHVVAGRKVRLPVMRGYHAGAVSWPAAGRGTAVLGGGLVSGGGPGRLAGGPSAGSVRAGDLGVWVGPADSAGGGEGARTAADVPSSVVVSVASHGVAAALGVRGAVLSVVPGSGAGGRVHVSVDYSGFAAAYGGGYASRLELVELPGCAVTTPGVAACRRQSPVPGGSADDVAAGEVGADVTLPGTPASAASAVRGVPGRGAVLVSLVRPAGAVAAGVVLAVTSGVSGSAGNFGAEPLSEATNAWVQGPSSGAYTYSYPVQVPPVPGGLEPGVDLSYDSQATSGLTSSTNNQASWLGDGFSYSPGFIETDYQTCSTEAGMPVTGDLCPGTGGGEVSLDLGGQVTPLVHGASGWAAAADAGEQVKQSGNTWEVILPDGTQLYFGLNQLPGYASGDQVTGSQLTVPVYEGCGQPAFCTLPWRDMLDYEVDPHGNAMAFFYSPQVNYYAENDGTTGTGEYVQGVSLTRIEYGLRAQDIYGYTPAGQVNFTVTAGRQDAPADLSCGSGAACAVTSPSFWTDDELTGISTQALEGGSLADVDSWALAGSYPVPADTTSSPSLWLSSITRTGLDGTTPVTLPPVVFTGQAYPNRVETAADYAAGYSDLSRFYLTDVTNQAGGVTSIAYSAAASTSMTFPAPDANATSVYPGYWVPAGQTAPVQDWFNQYSAVSVTEQDATGGDPAVVTGYTYAGPAWHWDEGTLSRSATVTWDQWRGWQRVTTQTGSSPDVVTEDASTFLQGMSQDGPPSGTGPAVTLTTSQGQQVADDDQFAGMPLEDITYDGAGSGQVVTDAIMLPWSSSAVETNGTLDQAAYLTGTNSELTYVPLAAGGTRESAQSYTYNSIGLQVSDSDQPDLSVPSESTCTDTEYAANTATGLTDLPESVTQDAGACNASGNGTGAMVRESEYFYDGGGLGAAPSAGNLTKTGQAVSDSGAAPIFAFTQATYDEYGRVLTSVNADGKTTTTAYTPVTGAEPVSVTVTDPMLLATTTAYDPARDLPVSVTQPDSAQTITSYDALGRPVAQWNPGNPDTGPADDTWSYTVSSAAPPVTTEQVLQPGGGYLTTQTLGDSLGNTRETQQETAGGGTDVTDYTYDQNGRQSMVSGPYYVTGPPTGTLIETAAAGLSAETAVSFDGDGRTVRQVLYDGTTEKWETDTSYGGGESTVTPPAGGTPETTWTNGLGQVTAIWQYHAGVPVAVTDPAADYDATAYTYNPGGELAGITDAAGNKWSYAYDLLGDQLTATDPDAGTTASSYDPAQLLTSVTDARGKTVSYAYDNDGRKNAEYDTTGGALETSSDELASWTWDTLAPGQLTSSTAYSGGASYTEEVTGYNAQGLPSGTATVIPSAQGALAGTYTQGYTYAPTGQETSYTDSAAAGLPAETVTTGYNTAGEPDSLTGAAAYVDTLAYTSLGQPMQYTLGTAAEPAYITDSYDPTTSELNQQDTQTGTALTQVDDLNYAYNNDGSIKSEADTPSGNPAADDTQCFTYDYLNRLVQAWAQGSGTCAATPSASAEGGPAPYWDTYTYNTTGNLTGITSTAPSGAVTTTADTYPAAGAAQPHAITGQAVTTPAGTTTSSYAYNADGDLTTLTSPSQDQALTWNDAGQLTTDAVTPPGGTAKNTSYTYNAAGTLLITADPAASTLYLPDEEITSTGGTLTGTRYYTLGTTPVASLTSGTGTGTGLYYLAGDQQDTENVAINATTLAPANRYYDPYGNPIGTPAAFPDGQKGFIGGTTDTSTGLTTLGARQYQPQTGSFINPDPLLTPYNPQDLNAYTYAADNPTTLSDPTGQCANAGDDFCVSDSVQSFMDYSKHYKPSPEQPTWCSENPVACINQADADTGTHHTDDHHSGGGCSWLSLSWSCNSQGWVNIGHDIAAGWDKAEQITGSDAMADCIASPSADGCTQASAVYGMSIVNGLQLGIDPVTDSMEANMEATLDTDDTVGQATEDDSSEAPSIIYRGGGKAPSNFRLREGEEALSFRDSLSNPLSPGLPVLLPGKDYVGIDTSLLPPGSVVSDGVFGSALTPPGHVSVYLDDPMVLKAAIIEFGRFPK